MAHPKVGMHFKDARKRLMRIKETERQGKVKNAKLQKNLEKSLLNQVKLAEGEQAVRELRREIDSNNHSLPRCGYSKQYAENWDGIFKQR
jgi:hypothetical protein